MIYIYILLLFLIFFLALFYIKKQEKLLCHICNKQFIGNEKSLLNKQNYCKKHLTYIKNNLFIQVITTISDPDKPDDSLLLYKIKDLLWKERIICYTCEHYIEKENIIHTTVTLCVEQKNITVLHNYLQKYFIQYN